MLDYVRVINFRIIIFCPRDYKYNIYIYIYIYIIIIIIITIYVHLFNRHQKWWCMWYNYMTALC